VAVATALVGFGLLVAACGGSGGSANPGVASAGSSGGGHKASTGTKPSTLAYAKCIQSHGFPSFPEPGANGSLSIGPGQSLPDVNSPKFQAAAKTCASLNPNGQAPSSSQQTQYLAAELKFAQCMRSHGVANFPDPTSSGSFNLQGIDVNSPQVQAANSACATPSAGIGIGSGRAGQ
jgi:hypothetical protein